METQIPLSEKGLTDTRFLRSKYPVRKLMENPTVNGPLALYTYLGIEALLVAQLETNDLLRKLVYEEEDPNLMMEHYNEANRKEEASQTDTEGTETEEGQSE